MSKLCEYWTDGSHTFWYGERYSKVKPVGRIAKDSKGTLYFIDLSGEVLATFNEYPTVFELAEAWEQYA